MKNKLHVVFATVGIFLLSVATVIFADAPIKDSTAFKSGVSSISSVQQEHAITNEAEYAEFVKKRDEASQASSVKSATSRSTSSGSSQKAIK